MDCLDLVQGLHSFLALDFFLDLIFIQWESLRKKNPLFSIDWDLKMQEMAS